MIKKPFVALAIFCVEGKVFTERMSFNGGSTYSDVLGWVNACKWGRENMKELFYVENGEMVPFIGRWRS
jgi:hypothetical protein